MFVSVAICPIFREKCAQELKRMEDYRKADPNYTEFIPRTASEAIDLFTRHRRRGVPVALWPETFIHVARALNDAELDRFQEWLVNPQGPRTTAGPLYEPCPEIETERAELAAEADARDLLLLETNPEPVGKGLEEALQVGPEVTQELDHDVVLVVQVPDGAAHLELEAAPAQ